MAVIMKTGGGGGKPNVLTVSIDTGATVTATGNGKVVSGVSVDGKAVLKLPKPGVWSIFAELDGQTAEDVIEISDDYPVEVAFGLKLSSLAEGSLIRLNESGSGVNFYLAKHDYESGLNGAGRELLVRKDCYDTRRWNSSAVNAYASSEIDSWMNSTYKGLLDPTVQAMIGTTKFYYTPGNGNNSVSTLERGVFSLSVTELGHTHANANVEGSALPIASSLRVAYKNGSAVVQHTRTPNKANKTDVMHCHSNGNIYAAIATNAGNIDSRPCFTIPANALASPEPNADGSYTLMV